MVRSHTSVPFRFSAGQFARLWFVLAMVFFSLAGGSYYWKEAAQYHTYLGIGLVLSVLGLLPFLVHALHSRTK